MATQPGYSGTGSGDYLTVMNNHCMQDHGTVEENYIVVPSRWRLSSLCGLCGNYNQNGTDDYLMPNGKLATSAAQLGDSWKAEGDDDAGCKPDEPHIPSCDPINEEAYKKMCEVVISTSGAFAKCHAEIDPEAFLKTCIYDMCQFHGMESTLCDNFQAYAEACRAKGINILWRNETFCREFSA
uniref:Zonadhesin-like n=1 Tax=Petromyzon marinus TaxID=7757 RepID=A0AAJ7U9W5_PETMA|nr:zonadhesin-like [Petromyzon marinus]